MRKRKSGIKNKFNRKLSFGSGLNFRRRRHRFDRDIFKSRIILILELVAVVMLAFVLTISFGYRVHFQGESMGDTLREDTTVWVNRVAYRISEPGKGDIIAFLPNGSMSASYSIKRIVAAGGDTVLIEGGKLYVNGEKVELSNPDAQIAEAGRAVSEIKLADGEYFVLGDNPDNSEDSRYESIGNVKREQILGKVWFICSLKDFGMIN